MGVMNRVRRGLRAMLPPLCFLLLTGYFGWSATQGERGLQSYVLRQAQLVSVQAELHRVEKERDGLERRVAGLRGSRLDPDTLDERVRAALGQTDPAEVVVLWSGEKRLF